MLTPLQLSSTECAVLSEQTRAYHLADCLPKHHLGTWHLWSPATKQPLRLLLWSAPLTLWLVPTSDLLWGLVQILSMSFSILWSWYFNTFLHLQCHTLPWPLKSILLTTADTTSGSETTLLHYLFTMVYLPSYTTGLPLLALPSHHAPSFKEGCSPAVFLRTIILQCCLLIPFLCQLCYTLLASLPSTLKLSSKPTSCIVCLLLKCSADSINPVFPP